jgi:hypothetical protein
MNTTLQCLECGEIFITDDPVSVGGLPLCGDCGGALTIPGVLEIACCNCDFTQKVTGINVNECSACPKCGWALDVISQDIETDEKEGIDDTIQKESDYAELNSDATIALAASPVTPTENLNVDIAAPAVQKTGETIAILPEKENYPDDDIPPSAETVIVNSPPPPKLKKEETTGISEKNFGKYEILGEIARGGMGIIYRVMDPDLKRELALKVLIAGEGASEDLLKRFMREARAAAQMNHPNVVPIHEVGNIKGQYYFTMDLIEGTSFDKIVAGKWMPVDEQVGHIRDIAQALKVAHSMKYNTP